LKEKEWDERLLAAVPKVQSHRIFTPTLFGSRAMEKRFGNFCLKMKEKMGLKPSNFSS